METASKGDKLESAMETASSDVRVECASNVNCQLKVLSCKLQAMETASKLVSVESAGNLKTVNWLPESAGIGNSQ